ncbi:hypothetical protein B7P43_G09541 [Cryptotermes secundus]|uniref:Uncharacterized protein n=1 Tax=Cryptotermes secundus TaxID=105785 RepID=A0A2J7QML9_9NEOP|nr:hypothetical protein B7P43_G09541 [Cryptotermes secundus]
MASLKELVDALVCDYLIKQDPHLGKIFKKKTLARPLKKGSPSIFEVVKWYEKTRPREKSSDSGSDADEDVLVDGSAAEADPEASQSSSEDGSDNDDAEEVPEKEEGSDSDASDASDVTDEDEGGSSLSEELEAEKPAAQKRKNEYHEEEEKDVKSKKKKRASEPSADSANGTEQVSSNAVLSLQFTALGFIVVTLFILLLNILETLDLWFCF